MKRCHLRFGFSQNFRVDALKLLEEEVSLVDRDRAERVRRSVVQDGRVDAEARLQILLHGLRDAEGRRHATADQVLDEL